MFTFVRFIIAVPETLDDILFEHRNKEYGSYRLRKQYYLRLAIGFIFSLTLVLLISLSSFWYLNSAGDASVYLYPYTGANLKSAQGNMMDPKELQAYLENSPAPAEKQPDAAKIQESDKLQNFKVVENAANDTFKPVQEEVEAAEDPGAGLGLTNDSTVFGGFLLGNGDGTGSGSDLDRFPVFPGGLDAVRRYIELNVKYPPQAIKQKIHGVVLISFDVNKQGSVDNIRVERSINPMVDAEAIRAIQTMPRWKPGMRRGKPVIVKFIIPVNFMPLS
jgi:periplasmic protein TonB